MVFAGTSERLTYGVLDASNTDNKIVVATLEVCNGSAVWGVSDQEQ